MGELVGACVLVGIADGAGVAVLANGVTLVDVGVDRSNGVVATATTTTVSAAADGIAVGATSAGPIELQPATMTAVNRIKAISLGGLSFLRSAGFSGTIALT